MAEITVLRGGRESISDTLARNLHEFMLAKEVNQPSLAKKSGVGQTTISLYLDPSRRAEGKTGKVPSPTLAQVQKLADALEVELWELLRPLSQTERVLYKSIEAAFRIALAQASRQETLPQTPPDQASPRKSLPVPRPTAKPARKVTKRRPTGTGDV